MRQQDLKPIEHNKFIGAVDSEYTDAQDLPITALAKTTNLTQFRKIGALVQAPGTSFKVFNGENLSSASMPIIAGFSPIQFESFTIDRDEKEILLVVYKNVSNETKMFIQPYWNPSELFSNHNPLKTAESWVYEWLELTETYSFTVKAGTAGNDLIVNETVSQADHYFDKWFVVNDFLHFTLTGAFNENKFNYVESQEGNTFTLKADVTGWAENHGVTLVRFPVKYLYNAITPNGENAFYNGIGTTFKAVPTQYVKGLNQVRMPCGKENKPLVLDMIFKRNYLIGNDIMSYDGFWFDFQQPQQVLFKSAISSYGDLIGTASTTYRYFDPTDTSTMPSTAPAVNYIRFKYTGTTTVTVKIKGNVLGMIEAFKYEILNGIHTISIRGAVGSPSLSDFKTFLDANLGYIFEFTLSGAYTALNLNYNLTQSFVYGVAGTSLGVDAGNNKIASNYFLGTQIIAKPPNNATIDPGCPMIITAVLDGRNEVVLGHGNICTTPSGIPKGGFELYFNCWFSRKITHIALYNKASEVITPSVFASNQYPYFGWLKGIKINELPLLALISIYDPAEAIYGEIPVVSGKSDYSLGYNSFKFDGTRWFIYINKDVNTINVVGKGLKFIVRTNRWIDQDITMNYTRMCFIGQTNGRFFVTNCKNTVEKEVFENNDLVLYSNFCAGISAYDIYTRDKNVAVAIGDKDTNVDLLAHKGYVMLIKQTNNYLINVKTGNELQYTIVDTMTGRGANDYNSICSTPYGVIVCAKDSIYLLNNSSVTPLLTETNGRLKLYLDKFAGKLLQCQYYNDKNELIIISTDNTNSRTNGIATILVYNFRYRFWTVYEYATSTNPIWTTIDHDKNILMLNYKDADNFNVAKMDESSSTFLSPYGSNIDMHWEIETHSVPYSNNLVDIELDWIDFIVNYTSSADRTLKINMKFDDDTNDITDYITLTSSASVEKKNHLKSLLINPTLSRTLTLNVKNLSSSSVIQKFAYFSLNSFIYWINSLQRKRQTN